LRRIRVHDAACVSIVQSTGSEFRLNPALILA
jgi:hypothetical protein